MFLGPLVWLVEFLANVGTAGETFRSIASFIAHPSKLLWWRKPAKHYVMEQNGDVIKVDSEPAEITPEIAHSLQNAEEDAEQLDHIIEKLTPSKADLHKMSKLELQIVANAHDVELKKRATKKEIISTIIKKLKL